MEGRVALAIACAEFLTFTRLVHVEDPENLTESFIERLRSRETAGSTFLSHGIDFDHLARRLEDIPASPASTTSTEESGEDGHYRLQMEHRKKQKECYYKLVEEGGRPSHSISLGREVLQNPDYEEILAYWGLVNDGGHGRVWDGFEIQLSAWREFWKWQRSNREEGRFDIYAASVRKSLQKHGFQKPFQLNADPTQQDKLTTWIEYLEYTYYWHNKDLRFLQRLQPQYDEAWSKLQDSKLFLPNETEEFIWSSASVIQHGRETMQAESAVESAKGVISHLESCGRSQHQIHREALAAANSTLESAENVLAIIQRRNSLVAEFHIQFGQMRKVNGILQKSYREVQKDARQRSILLRWILQQLPLIELELENDTSGINCRKRKARDSCHDKSNDLETAKRQRRAENSSRNFGTSVSNWCQNSRLTTHDTTSTAGSAALPNKRTTSNPLRRSTRIRRPPVRYQ